MNAFTVTLDTTPGRTTAEVSGDLDIQTAPELKMALAAPAATGAHLVIDLARLTFIDSSGLSVFIALHRHAFARGGSVTLRSVPPFAAQALAITQLDKVFTVHGDDDVG